MRSPAELLPGHPGVGLLLELDLTRGLAEAPPSTPIEAARTRHVPQLRQVADMLRRAAADDRVVGLIAHIGGHQPTLAQSEELRRAVAAFRAAGKGTVCWTESFGEMRPGNVLYHLASAFEEVWLQPSGDLGLTGVVVQAVFLRGTLDKLGIEPEVHQRKEFKTASNTFLETSMTDAHREMATAIVASATETIVHDVAAARGLSEAAVRDAIDHAPLTPDAALDRRLVDHIGYRDEVYAALRDRYGEVRLRYLHRYGKGLAGLASGPQTSAVGRAVGSRLKSVASRGGPPAVPTVAVVHATGAIHLGRSGRSPLGGASIGSDSLGGALRSVAADDSVAAVVLRVNSGGGSYAASDAIHREVLAVRRAGKPVIASMGSVAGSGGYYISMGADAIVADAGTLTGSIGVLYGKQVIRGLLDRVGLSRESVSSGAFAEMFSTQRPFTPEEWERLDAWLDSVYRVFVTTAARDRGMAVGDLEAVARGRVWTGADASKRGLVDELGGLEEAVGLACRRAGLDRSAVNVKVLPKPSIVERIRPAESSEHPAAGTGRLGWLGWLGSNLGPGSARWLGSNLGSGVLPGVGAPGVLSMPLGFELS
ncbi:MAG TPA: signal peptide peptidase SppA [Nocardioidaceae bacterium]|nr:signal peptide peptidase SppA [Nocardioidaceae bacterium]